MTNKKLGNDFERELCDILSENGFWVHNFTQNQAGQPADIIAVRDGIATLIDAKVCSNDKFKLERIEENQNLSMKLWKECGNNSAWFVLKIDTGIYMISREDLSLLSGFRKHLTKIEIEIIGIPLKEWIGR